MDKKYMETLVQKYTPEITSLSDQIWTFAEEHFEETRSSALQAQFLKEKGFSVSFPSPLLPTAFMASFGQGRPVIGFLGEYDALPGLSQKADALTPCPEKTNLTGCGHGCGHNLLGCGAIAAALMVKDILKREQLPGTVIYFGCPAEENTAGKSLMIQEGMFQNVDLCLTWHPHYQSGLFTNALANYRVSYRFHGVSAHAAQAPHLGRSALDACELMNVGTNYLREHMIDEARVHYAYLNTGGTAPNIVPAEAEIIYSIRAPRTAQAEELKNRVNNIARGAALMTDTTVEIDEKCHYDDFKVNPVLNQLLLKHLDACTPISYSEEELAYARNFVPLGSLPDAKEPIELVPDFSPDRPTGVSTDAGNVSQIIPCAACTVTCYANGSPLHHWSITAQGKSSIAYKGMMTAAKILTLSAWELLENPALLKEVLEY